MKWTIVSGTAFLLAWGFQLSMTIAFEARCYQFTWVGAENDDMNTTTCGTLVKKGAATPCFEPLVYTKGVHFRKQPVIQEVVDACEKADTLNGNKCNPYCTKADDICIKMTYFMRDGSGLATNATWFCGQGVETTSDGQPIKNACHYQENVGGSGYDLEACFCDNDRCNGARERNAGLVGGILMMVGIISRL